MREIKFRGKSQIDGNWFYGSLIIKESLIPNFDNLNELKYIKCYEICCKDENDWTSQYYNVPVFEGTIGQYTGLKDKNGTEIYEGDIILTQLIRDKPFAKKHKEKRRKAVVEWRSGFNNYNQCNSHNPEFDARFIDKEYDYGCYSWTLFYECEVIGNIYDNPEFLEEV